MPQRKDTPWLEGHETKIQEEHRKISQISSELFSLIEALRQGLTGGRREKGDEIKAKHEERKRSRRKFKKKLRRWERLWWQELINSMQFNSALCRHFISFALWISTRIQHATCLVSSN